MDTNVCIALMEERENPRQRLEQARIEGERVCLSSIVYYELMYGAFKSERLALRRISIEMLLDSVDEVLDFSAADGESAAEIRAILERQAVPIGHYDLLIAGHAVSRNLILVTANTREFARVPNLKWQDWERA